MNTQHVSTTEKPIIPLSDRKPKSAEWRAEFAAWLNEGLTVGQATLRADMAEARGLLNFDVLPVTVDGSWQPAGVIC